MENYFGVYATILGKTGRFNEVLNGTKLPATSSIGSHNSIGENVAIGENVTIGNNVTIQRDVVIGDSCVIGNNVTLESDIIIGDGCIIGNNVSIQTPVEIGNNNVIHDNCVFRGNTIVGNNNEFLPGSIIGFWPKDIGDPHYEGLLTIGDNNFFGECTVINIGEKTENGDTTEVGCGIYSMDFVTINHNDKVAVGNEIPMSKRAFTTILSSKVSLAGHVEVGTGANLGMQTVAHQFSKIGAGAMIGMNASVSKNVVPFAKVIGNKVVGINKRPLAENLEFGTYDDDTLATVAAMVETAARAADDRPLQKIENFANKGRWNDSAYKVVKEFLESPQNGRKLMKWGK